MRHRARRMGAGQVSCRALVVPSARVAPRAALLVALACALLPTGARAEAEGSLRLSASAGADSNAHRDFLQTGPVPDFVASALAEGRGQLVFDTFEAQGRYEAGVRGFLRAQTENALAQGAALEVSQGVARGVRLGLLGDGKDRQGERAYTDLLGGGFVEVIPETRLEVRLELRAHRFVYWQAFEYSFAAPEATALVRYRFDRRHSVQAFGEVGARTYNAVERLAPDGTASGPLERRQDGASAAGISYAYRGPFTLTVGYGFVAQRSNSFGESFQRHRLSVTGAVRLPWRLILLWEGAVQLSRYPDGVYLSQDFTLKQDDESFNQLSLRLVKPLSTNLDLELSAGLFHTRFPANGLTYLRGVGAVGVSFRL